MKRSIVNPKTIVGATMLPYLNRLPTPCAERAFNDDR